MLASRRVFAEERWMPAPSLPPDPALLLHALDRWLEQQADRLASAEFARLLDRLRPRLAALESALADHDLAALALLIEQLASDLDIAELQAPLRVVAPNARDPAEPPLGVPTHDRSTVGEAGQSAGSTPPLRTLFHRLQQVLQPRQLPTATSLAVSSPSQVALHQRFPVEIQADLQPPSTDTSTASLTLPASGPLDLEVELQLADAEAFAVLTAPEGLLRVLPDGRSTRLSFLLCALQPGRHRLTVVFRQHAMERRRITRTVVVCEAVATSEDSCPGTMTTATPCLISPAPPPRGIVLRLRLADRRGPSPLFVGELAGPGLLRAPLRFDVPLGREIDEACAEFCRRIDDLTDLPTALESERRVRALGEWLAKLLLRDEPRRILDSPDIPDGTPLHIESHDLWVPWELLLLNDRRSGHEQFLGEKFAVSRWIDAGGASESVGAGGVTLVAPDDPQLSVAQERRVLAQLRQPALCEIKSLAEVQALLHGTMRCGVLHFACHADSSADRVVPDYLVLQDDVLLRPFDVPAARNDVVRAIAGGLVFINACQTAIVAPSMARDRGWARAFLGGGAAALLACAWTVKNGIATRFAEEFYRQARLGVTLAEAARQARCRIRPLGEHEPLGYALYAAPEARLLPE